MEAAFLFEGEEHAAVRALAARFAREAIAPHADAWEEGEAFPVELYRAAAAVGLPALGYPESVGGSGDLTHAIVAADELVRVGKSVGTVVGLGSHSIALPPIVRAGSAALHERYVRPTLRGELVAALAISEPGAGSDVASLACRAERRGDVYVVSGQKTFITSGSRADFVTAAVRTGGPGHGGLSLLVVDKAGEGRPGFRVGRALHKTGWWPSDTAELFFDDVEVPVANLLGEENEGFGLIAQNFVAERLLLAAQCVAIAQLAYDESVAYVRERRAFGKTVMAFQVTRHKLADMACRLAAARALVSEVAQRHLRDAGGGFAEAGLAAMCKNVATDMLTFVTNEAVQLHGGMGYMRGVVVERLYRDARLYPIGGGTREIMNEIISKAEGF